MGRLGSHETEHDHGNADKDSVARGEALHDVQLSPILEVENEAKLQLTRIDTLGLTVSVNSGRVRDEGLCP